MADPPPPSRPHRIFAIAIATELGMGLCALVLGWLFGPNPRLLVPTPGEWGAIAAGIGWGLAAAVPVLVGMLVAQSLPSRALRELQEISRQLIVPTLGRLSLVELAIVSLAAGVGEELLFRGWLQVALTGPPATATPERLVAGVAVASVLFGIAHPISRAYVAFATLMGLYLGALLAWSENLLMPITAHAGYDFLALVYLIHHAKREKQGSPSEPDGEERGGGGEEPPAERKRE